MLRNLSDSSAGEDDSQDEDVPPKRPRFDNSGYTSNDGESDENEDNKREEEEEEEEEPETSYIYKESVKKIMRNMGHVAGRGLGKHQQGIVKPIKTSDQKGRMGLGFCPEAYKPEEVDPEVEGVYVKEEVRWLENTYEDMPERNTLNKWLKIGPENLSLDDENKFCSPETLSGVLKAKSALDDLKDVSKIVSRCNPFETIGHGIFLNRAAMKMVNMDKITDFMFTEPKDKYGEEIVKPGELFYFADVCAGPGGFSEYIFYRKKWRAKGFGFTLKAEHDFQLDDFLAGPCETFVTHYGAILPDQETGDGDVFKPENINSFSSYVLGETNGEGVHLMMADGGFGIDEKSIQEILSKQLYLCQCLVALKIVRTKGNFVVKLFDIFTPFSVGLVYLMYRAFDRVSIHKPNSSRPANSERYLICQYKRENCTELADFLFDVNKILCDRHKTKKDVLELVPLSILEEDSQFFDYVFESNNRIGIRQIHHLKNVVIYSNHPDLVDSRQDKLKRQCMEYWGIPMEARTDTRLMDPAAKIKELLGNSCKPSASDLNVSCEIIEPYESLTEKLPWKDKLYMTKNFYWTVVGGYERDKLTLYLGLGRGNVYRFSRGNWVKVDNPNQFHLPPGTLVYAETIEENRFNEDSRVKYRIPVFHIVDGMFLGGEDIRNRSLTERIRCCEMFAKALTKSNAIYRTKEWLNYEDLKSALRSSLHIRYHKNGQCVTGYNVDKDKFILPRAILFYNVLKADWVLNLSRSQNKIYYENLRTKRSVWADDVGFSVDERHPCADFWTSYKSRILLKVDEDYLKKVKSGDFHGM